MRYVRLAERTLWVWIGVALVTGVVIGLALGLGVAS
jgi:hypothetical protein